ncbi:MAG TPA: tetratricopeptide repeat protein [Candidatus Kapabacteria bacterium]|nr:tetratricopeptide repeat protein [Candidatus Kapabacteria bacterium]
MRYYLLVFVLVCFSYQCTLGQEVVTEKKKYFPSMKKISNKELGRRYIKLGNTWREGGNLELAEKYLRKGIKIVTAQRDNYWIGVANEYLGYLFEDLEEYNSAIFYLETAKDIYKKYGFLRNGEGSNNAINSSISRIQHNRNE